MDDRLSRLFRLAPAVAVAGLIVLVIGTFLPWLQSGDSQRNSYQASGTLRRILDPPGLLGALFAVWPLLAAAAAGGIALLLLGFRRSGAFVATVAALVGGGTAFEAVRSASNTYASVIVSGPSTTLVGSALVLASAPICVVFAHPPHRST